IRQIATKQLVHSHRSSIEDPGEVIIKRDECLCWRREKLSFAIGQPVEYKLNYFAVFFTISIVSSPHEGADDFQTFTLQFAFLSLLKFSGKLLQKCGRNFPLCGNQTRCNSLSTVEMCFSDPALIVTEIVKKLPNLRVVVWRGPASHPGITGREPATPL